jgi:hypothetical protein
VFRAPDTLGGSVLLRSRRRSRRLRFGRRLGLPDGAATEQSVSEYIYGYRTNAVEPLGPRNPTTNPRTGTDEVVRATAPSATAVSDGREGHRQRRT